MDYDSNFSILFVHKQKKIIIFYILEVVYLKTIYLLHWSATETTFWYLELLHIQVCMSSHNSLIILQSQRLIDYPGPGFYRHDDDIFNMRLLRWWNIWRWSTMAVCVMLHLLEITSSTLARVQDELCLVFDEVHPAEAEPQCYLTEEEMGFGQSWLHESEPDYLEGYKSKSRPITYC